MYVRPLLTQMRQFLDTVLQARQKKNIKKQTEVLLERPFSSFMFWIDVSLNQLGPCRSLLDLCFINAVRLSTWTIYKSSLTVWKRAIRRKMHTLFKFQGRAQNIHGSMSWRSGRLNVGKVGKLFLKVSHFPSTHLLYNQAWVGNYDSCYCSDFSSQVR